MMEKRPTAVLEDPANLAHIRLDHFRLDMDESNT